MERERNLARGKIPKLPLRATSVSQVIIKAHVRWYGDRFLMEYDKIGAMYQLIGGHVREDDTSVLEAVSREIREELPRNNFDFESRDSLRQLASSQEVLMSRTLGVNTEYSFTIFHVQFGLQRLIIKPAVNRWVSLKELKQGRTRSGDTVANDWVRIVDDVLPGGVSKIDSSLAKPQFLPWKQVLRDHPWEVLGSILGVAGLLLGGLQLYLM